MHDVSFGKGRFFRNSPCKLEWVGKDRQQSHASCYSVAVVNNLIYDVDPDERTGTVAYYKSGHDDDDDDIEEVVKVCA